MHIALVSRWYPPHTGYGGVAAYNYYLAHALVGLGHRVTVIAARWSPTVPERQADGEVMVERLLSQYRYRHHRLPLLGRNIRALQQLLYSRQVAQALGRLAAQDRPDVAEFAEVNAEGFVYLRRRARVPVVVRCHTPTFVLQRHATAQEAPYNTLPTVLMEKYCIRSADAISAPSQDMAQTIARACGVAARSIAVVPNGLDIDLFAPGSERRADNGHADQDAKVIVLHVGRLDRVKGVAVLVRAIPAVLAQASEAHFVFAGEGSMWQERLTSYLCHEKVADRVTFLGGVEQETLAAWYRKADIAVVPTLNYESFSYTCAQAMAAGLPLVASQIGGIPETVGNGASGILVQPGDVAGLAEAITRLIRDPQLRRRLGDAGRVRAERLFAADVVARQMLALYRTIAHRAAIGD